MQNQEIESETLAMSEASQESIETTEAVAPVQSETETLVTMPSEPTSKVVETKEPNTIVRTHGITKKYGQKTVVDSVSMHIREGDIYGFIGSNGAGKTTFIRCLMGLVHPTAGEYEILGCSSRSKEIHQKRQQIGAIVEVPALMHNLTAYRCLKAHAMLYYKKIDDAKIKELLALVGLQNTGNKKVRDFSLGMRQRMAIAQALVGDPKVLILDEPTNGMDPQGIIEMRHFLHMLRDTKGLTILVSSHILGELQLLANRFGIIDNGKLVDEFDASSFAGVSGATITLQFEGEHLQKAKDLLATSLSEGEYTVKDGQITLPEKDFAKTNKWLVIADIEYSFAAKSSKGLEDYFMDKIGKKQEQK